MKLAIVEKNSQGGYFERGKKLSKAKWASVIDVYQTKLNSAGNISSKRRCTMMPRSWWCSTIGLRIQRMSLGAVWEEGTIKDVELEE